MKYHRIKPISKAFKIASNRAMSLSGITRDELMNSMDRRHVMWRQAVYYMLREQGYTYAVIGHAMKRDHSTIQHACKKFADLLDIDMEIKKLYTDLTDGSSNY